MNRNALNKEIEIELPLGFLYSFMGWVALHAGRMSRRRVNFVPSHIVVMGLLLMVWPVGFILYIAERQWWMLLLLILGVVMFVSLLISSAIRHTVFQRKKSASPLSEPLENYNGVVLFNGKMRLSEKMVRRFQAVPAHIATLEDGSLGFASRIDASTTMYGLVMSERRGVWYSVPSPGSLEITDGVFYYGAKGRPALRLTYVEKLDPTRRTEVAVVAFASEASRERARLWFAEKVNPPFKY